MKPLRSLTVLLTVILSPLLTGCWGYKEFEHQFYPHAVAVGKVGNQYLIYVQVLDMSKLGRSESPTAKTGAGSWIAIAKGQTLDEAAHDLYQVTPRSVNWGHVNAILISENLLKAPDWANVFGVLTRFAQFRYTPWIFTTQDDLQTVLATPPIIEVSPVHSGLGDPMELYKESSFIRPIRMNSFIADMSEPTTPHLIPEVSLQANRWYAGQEPHSTITLSGYAMFDAQRKFVGSCTREKCAGLRWADPKLQRTSLNLTQNGKAIGSAIVSKPRYRVRYALSGQNIRYQVSVSVRGIVPEKYGNESLAALDKLAEREIRNEIYETYRNGLQRNMDLFGLTDALYRSNPGLYHQLKKRGALQLTDSSLSSVQVKVQLMTGIRTLEGPQEQLTQLDTPGPSS
ncbi:Ger(x)C family spore germination protein [Alicyclobacillus ferrooxydans]|uniref:Uncharacterized protein n=1 Tax=Alicyclobacillus ferrooxydans TaxID=471514 RepID=A0A0P9CC98_9BACL|nr:Ger(x)C family spore germination protein [Alicyclobacillus ferrooxydans]KPV43097.1 hypothetical protein AN477_14290 [Alicyclobacillus ferrooxydans]